MASTEASVGFMESYVLVVDCLCFDWQTMTLFLIDVADYIFCRTLLTIMTRIHTKEASPFRTD